MPFRQLLQGVSRANASVLHIEKISQSNQLDILIRPDLPEIHKFPKLLSPLQDFTNVQFFAQLRAGLIMFGVDFNARSVS